MTSHSAEPHSTSDPKFRVAQKARFGRAPRVLPAKAVAKRPARRRTDIERAFEDNFTRLAHQQRYRAVRDSITKMGEVTERICRNYATFSDRSGTQFAVVKPLSDGGLRIGLSVSDDTSTSALSKAVGLGSSAHITHQFELESYESICKWQLVLLQKAYDKAIAHST